MSERSEIADRIQALRASDQYRRFLKNLRRGHKRWFFTSRGFIRTDDFLFCPLAVAAGVDWGRAWYALGLTVEEADEIIFAADAHGDYDPAIRADLLAACGLSEQERDV